MQLRLEIERRLRRRLSDDQWGFLKEQGYVAEVEEGREGVNYLLEISRRISTQAPQMKREGRSLMSPDRTLTLSEVVAELASEDPDVVSFRKTNLATGLIGWSELEAWIHARLAQEKGMSQYVQFPVPVGTVFERDPQGNYAVNPPVHRVTADIAWSSNPLLYAGPHDRWVRVVVPVIGGKLDRLRRLAQSLEAYGWTEAQGTIFCLTGVIPLVEPIRARHRPPPIRNRSLMGWNARIVLEIDPTTSPEELERVYRKLRTKIGYSHHRPLSAKHLALARFISTSGDESWRDRQSDWKREFPKWKYSSLQAANFRRDCIRAQLRLLNPEPGAL